jgi:serine/threonine protein kinase
MKKYKVCRCLATGGFSKVFLVRSKINGKFYAAKFIDRTKSSIISNSLLDYEK